MFYLTFLAYSCKFLCFSADILRGKYAGFNTNLMIFYVGLLNEIRTWGSDVLRYFPSKGCGNEWSKKQQMIFTRKNVQSSTETLKKVQAGSFRELLVWESTKLQYLSNFFALSSAYQNSNLRNGIRNGLIQEWSKSIAPSTRRLSKIARLFFSRRFELSR